MKEYYTPYWSNVTENFIILVCFIAYPYMPFAEWITELPPYNMALVFVTIFLLLSVISRVIRTIFRGKYTDNGAVGYLIIFTISNMIIGHVTMNSWIAGSWVITIIAALYFYYIPLNIGVYVYNKFKSRK